MPARSPHSISPRSAALGSLEIAAVLLEIPGLLSPVEVPRPELRRPLAARPASSARASSTRPSRADDRARAGPSSVGYDRSMRRAPPRACAPPPGRALAPRCAPGGSGASPCSSSHAAPAARACASIRSAATSRGDGADAVVLDESEQLAGEAPARRRRLCRSKSVERLDGEGSRTAASSMPPASSRRGAWLRRVAPARRRSRLQSAATSRRPRAATRAENAGASGQPQGGSELKPQQNGGIVGRTQRDRPSIEVHRGGDVRRDYAPACRQPPAAAGPLGASACVRQRRARAGSARPARGGSRRSRPARRGRHRARPASRRSARAGRRASDFGSDVVGGVADQQMPEAEAVLARRAAHGRGAPAHGGRARPGARVTFGSSGVERRAPAPRWKTSPSTAPRSSTRRSDVSSWSSRAASSAWSVRRHLDVTVAVCRAIASISCDEERVAAGRAQRSARRSSSGDAPADEQLDLALGERLEPQRDRPRRTAGRAARGVRSQTRRIGAVRRGSADVLDEIEERRPRPSARRRRRRRAAPAASSSFRKAQAISSRRSSRPSSPSSEREARSRTPPDRTATSSSCLSTSDDRPVRDPLAVGEAAAADDARVDRGEGLGDEARLPDSRLADDREELAPLLLRGALPRCPDLPRARARARRSGCLVRPLRRLLEADEAERRHRLALALELERLDRLDVDRAANKLERRLRRSAPRSVRPPAGAARRR